jgi:FKBP-type peptidyl-prolyl cis-trans isomerase
MSIRIPAIVLGIVALAAVEASGQERELIFEPSLGVDLSTMTRAPSGLYSRVLIEGQGEPATLGTRLQVEFTANLPSGTRFSATPPGQPLEFVLDWTTMIPGFIEGLMGIRPGESRLLVVPPGIGYGDRGVADVVPPGATIVFRVKRVDGRVSSM